MTCATSDWWTFGSDVDDDVRVIDSTTSPGCDAEQPIAAFLQSRAFVFLRLKSDACDGCDDCDDCDDCDAHLTIRLKDEKMGKSQQRLIFSSLHRAQVSTELGWTLNPCWDLDSGFFVWIWSCFLQRLRPCVQRMGDWRLLGSGLGRPPLRGLMLFQLLMYVVCSGWANASQPTGRRFRCRAFLSLTKVKCCRFSFKNLPPREKKPQIWKKIKWGV